MSEMEISMSERVNGAIGMDRRYSENSLAAKTPTITQQYGDLTKNLSILSEEIDRLEDRLRPVLGPEYPQASKGKEEAQESLSPFAEGIRSDVERIDGLISRVTYLRSRLEV